MPVRYYGSKTHSCHSQELGEPRPPQCRCRKFVSRAEADQKVREGEAEWLLDFSGSVPCPTWDIVLTNRRNKVPRAPTLEKAFLERGVEASDGGSFARELADVENLEETIRRFDSYHDLEIESRLLLFHEIGSELLALKKESDALGTVSGNKAKFVVENLIHQANQRKFETFVPGSEGPVLLMIGLDERTENGRGK